MITSDQIYEWLQEVKDPEIPVLSLVDLGVITEISIHHDDVEIEMTPTFVGCPAIDFMKNEIIEVLQKHGFTKVNIRITFRTPWTSDRITERGRAALKQFGLAPPPPLINVVTELDILEHATCPKCNSLNTQLKNTFGPTLCRSIHYCEDCKETFEQFKPL